MGFGNGGDFRYDGEFSEGTHGPGARDQRLESFAQGRWGDQGQAAVWLAMQAGGVSRPEVLQQATGDELLGVGRAWKSLETWCFTGKLAVVRELIRRYPLNEDDESGAAGSGAAGGLPGEWDPRLHHEVAAALGISVIAAGKLVNLAWTLDSPLRGIGRALEERRLDPPRARMIVDETAVLDREDLLARAEEIILDGLATCKTWPDLERLVQRAVITVDPDGARRRREQAEREHARVRFWRESTGTCALRGTGLPADEALAATANIEARALEYRAVPVKRPMDILRVMAYLDLINGVPVARRAAWAQAEDEARMADEEKAEAGERAARDAELREATRQAREKARQKAQDKARRRNAGASQGQEPYGSGPDDRHGHDGFPDDWPTSEGEGPDDEGPDDEGPGDEGPDDGRDEDPGSTRPQGGPDDSAPGDDSAPDDEGSDEDPDDGRDEGPGSARPQGGPDEGPGGGRDQAPGSAGSDGDPGGDCPDGDDGTGGLPGGWPPHGGDRGASNLDDGNLDGNGPEIAGRDGSPCPECGGVGGVGGVAGLAIRASLTLPAGAVGWLAGRTGPGPDSAATSPGVHGSGGAGGGGPGSSAPGSGYRSGPGPCPGCGNRGGYAMPVRGNLVFPLLTVLGLAERPGEAHGLGALDPSLVRALTAAGARYAASEFCVTVIDDQGFAVGHGCCKLMRGTAGKAGRATAMALGGASGASSARSAMFIPSGRVGPEGGFGSWILTLPGALLPFSVDIDVVPTYECDHRHGCAGYAPSARLRHLVQVRDGTCSFPACSRHAGESDFEHAQPFDKGGLTCACNAHACSRSCHRVKQSDGWTVTKPRPGWTQWTTMTGRIYTQGPWRYPA